MKNNFQKTMYACFAGYIVQAIVNNFVPLLFLTFEKSYHIPLSQITMLITFNFGIQLLVDLLSAGFVDRIGYRVGDLAGNTSECFCRITACGCRVCDRWRSDRGVDQSDR